MGASRREPDASRLALVLDIGGTKLAAALVDGDGRLHEPRSVPTNRAEGAQRVLDRALALLDEVLAAGRGLGRHPDALGVSSNGLTREDRVELAPAVGGWSSLRIPTALRERFPSLPTTIVNDVKAATKAELVWGALRGVSDGLYVNLGTGIAAGIIAGGRLIEGANGAAGEFGYIVPSLQSLAHHTPGEPALEERLGGRGVEVRTERELGRALGVEELLVNARRDEPTAEFGSRFLQEIALWVANVAMVLDPSRVVLGGGMMRSGERLCRLTQETVDRVAPFHIDVLPARFGAESALVGAGAVALSG